MTLRTENYILINENGRTFRPHAGALRKVYRPEMGASTGYSHYVKDKFR